MSTKCAAMFCMFLVIVQTREDMVLTRRVNHPENSLLDMLRRKLVFNNVDYDESSTNTTTSSTSSTTSSPSSPSSPAVCIMPTNNHQNHDIYNPDNNPYKSNNPSRDSKYLRQGKPQTRSNLYNPYHHPHYKPLHNPGYAPFHRAPYIVYANQDPPLNQPSKSPIYLRADIPINQVEQRSFQFGQNFPQISKFEPDILQYPSKNFRSSLDSQNPSPPFQEYPLHLQSESPRQMPQEANQNVKHLLALQNPLNTQNCSLTYRPPNPTPRNLPNPPHRSPYLYVPEKPHQRVHFKPFYQAANQLNRSYPLHPIQQKKPDFRAYRFIPTSRVTSTTTVMTFPTNSLKSIKSSDVKVNRLKPNTTIPEKDHKRFEVILNSTQPQSESMEAWTAGDPILDPIDPEKTFKGFKLAAGVTPIEISSESGEVKNKRQIKIKGNVDLDQLLNKVIKRAAKLRSTSEPLSFQKYQNQSLAARRSGSYLKWQLSHVIPQF